MRRYSDLKPPRPDLTWGDWVTVIGATVALVIIFLAFFAMFPVKIHAHEARSGFMYDPWCCSDRDCHEISADRVKSEPGGYVVDGRHHKTHKEVRFSPDGLYHACFFPDENTLRCLYVPPSGS